MFGRGKKKAEPAVPWAIQVLTTEYLVEGYVRPDDDPFLEISDENLDNTSSLQLTNVSVRPTGGLAAPARSYPVWNLIFWNRVVALIPRDDASLAAARQLEESRTHPLEVEVYIGPYRVLGTLHLSQPDVTDAWTPGVEMFAVLTDATLENLTPGAQVDKLTAPWLMLNGSQMHGFAVL
jgi:hypothetical protein